MKISLLFLNVHNTFSVLQNILYKLYYLIRTALLLIKKKSVYAKILKLSFQ